MALYGVDFYGASKYGPRVFLEFDAGPLVAYDRGLYGQLLLSWTTPGGSWSRLRLVRNAFGVPVTYDDGAVLLDSASGPGEPLGTRAPAVRSYLDTGLEPGRFQYYAIWLFSTTSQEWVRAASTTGLALKDHGYSERLWELTPSIYRTQTTGLLDADNETLRTFERVIGTQLDHIRSEYETLRDVNDPNRVSGNLLPLMAQQYGQFFEPELGMKQMRQLLRTTVYLYRNKGTYVGVEAFIKAVSGFGAKIQPLKNLLLDYNDSSAEESIGNWNAFSRCTLSRYVADGVVDAPSALGTMRRVGIFRQTTTTAGDTQLTLYPVSTDTTGRMLESVPVTAGQAYTVSGYSRAGTVARSGFLSIVWFDQAGVFINQTNGTATPNVVGTWDTRYTVTATAPATAVYGSILATMQATAVGEVHYWDGFQFEAGSVATDYEDARLIDIDVIAPRVNLVRNPSFEVDVSLWVAPAGTLTHSTVSPVYGTGSGRWVAAAGDFLSTTVDVISVGSTHTFSIYGTGTGTYELVARHAGSEVALGTSAPLVLDGTARRASVSFTPQMRNVILGIRCVAPGTGDWDAALAEAAPSMGDYYDGTTGAFIGDTLWEGAGNASRSHYYPLRRTKNFRMSSLLPEYTPMGSSFRLNYAQTPSVAGAKMGINLGPTFAG